ncbi:MAG: UDP-N-acetylmuramoylalanine--D-glutamate ligase [Candidatus Saccharibacteria bacterium]|nr:UDP-N-acetylmuramoylalanine--D-glutamate ligase [Candidatus Saccharibacteria bacterium]
MKIGIVGWGIEGQSAFKYFGPGHEYLIVNEHPRDDFPAPSEKIKINFLSGEKPPGITGNVDDLSYLEGLEACEKIIVTPTSMKNLEKKYPKNAPIWDKVTSVMEIFFDGVASRNIIGITGTKGKGTTSTLTAKMLEAAGKKVHLGGNIGISVLDFLEDVQPDDWVVLELSSFQLYSLRRSPHIGVCLMVVPEHMDWHADMADYVAAKSNMFKHQKTDDIAIYMADNSYSEKIANASPGKKIAYYDSPGARVRNDGMIVIGEPETELIHKSKVKLLGEHNLQNICAAATAAWQVVQDPKAIEEVAGSFSGLEHRLELVRELDGVKYYDDSFGTTPDTATVALLAFSEPKIIILGGSDKGAYFTGLAEAVVKSNVKQAIVIGQTADKISAALRAKGFNNIIFGLKTMPEIVTEARKHAKSGDVVLLSAASASFGLFHDYKDRGNQFKSAVNSLSSLGKTY